MHVPNLRTSCKKSQTMPQVILPFLCMFLSTELLCLVALILGDHLHLLLGNGFSISVNVSGDIVLQST